jgi:NAD(P)H-hydrate epimerase
MIRLTRAQVREVDRRAIKEYRIPGIVLMENAARAVVDAAWQTLAGRPAPVLVVCGGGSNGGDGLAVARHLHIIGCPVEIFLAIDPAKYAGDALTNWNIVQAMKIPIGWTRTPTLIIDALFGTGLSQAPRADSLAVIDRMNAQAVPILAIDVPSGLDCDTGRPLGSSCVRATRTVTFVAEKAGFADPESRQYTGAVVVGEIGCPRELIDAVRA